MADISTHPDKDYLDEAFVARINNTDNTTLQNIFNSLVSKYEIDFNYSQIESLVKEIKNYYSSDFNVEHFIRQLKYLVNKGIYGRITKKFKNELIELGVDHEKVGIIAEIIKQGYEKNLQKNEKKNHEGICHIKDIDIFTEMPVNYSDYHIVKDDARNIDVKKQNVYMNLTLSEDNKEKNCVLRISKEKLIGLYEQMEKLQEKLDQLA